MPEWTFLLSKTLDDGSLLQAYKIVGQGLQWTCIRVYPWELKVMRVSDEEFVRRMFDKASFNTWHFVPTPCKSDDF